MTGWRRPVGRAVPVILLATLLAWLGGGQAQFGRIDPALALPVLFPPLVLLAAWCCRDEATARRRALLVAAFGMVLAQAVLGMVLAGQLAWLQLALIATASLAAGLLAETLMGWRPRWRMLTWLVALLIAVGWFAASHAMLARLYRPAAAPADAPVATVLTGLPLRWSGEADLAAIIAGQRADDPALVRLEAAGPLQLVDSLVEHRPPPGGTLLLAHPRALAPQELVAIDSFVRGGGKAVILADALSSWPAAHPIGDPRNPPVTSLLTPLLDHWGVTLAAANPDAPMVVAADVDAARLLLASAGRFERLPSACREYADRHVARCPIGGGEVWLVGDADLLFAPLWTPAIPGAEHLRPADTMAWMAARLWPGAGVAPFSPLWIRSDAH
ncbi:MAG: hypothetical protein CVT78_08985 [Alphaproteobacteria bacterium HGW-Alphaproteobacteria-17]|nr:MAG: hypothetical protein CVT78_08985 [Alphaproteobacteria bacterium HGW-Alphaproteobacteria-17]